ncbi:MAG: hypothetical protein ACI32N_03055 [Bulleidia sp.]
MKNWIKGLMACGLAFALTTTVYAEGTSPTGVGTVVGVTIDGKETDAKVSFTQVGSFTAENAGGNEKAATAINSLSTGEKTVSDVVAEIMDSGTEFTGASKNASGEIVVKAANGETTVKMSEVKMLTPFTDLKVDGVTNAKNVKITWVEDSLTSGLGAVVILHYSTTRGEFELLLPDAVDYNTKKITCTFPDLSPVAVAYVPKDKVDTAISGKPVVDTHSNATVEAVRNNNSWMFMAGAVAVVACAAGYGIFRKKTQE